MFRSASTRVYRDTADDANCYRAMTKDLSSLISDVACKLFSRVMFSTGSTGSLKKSITALDDLVLHFLDATAFIEIEDSAFPAELAIVKFSLKEGIIDEFHTRINPGELPLGSAFPALDYSNKYHRMPLPPKCEGEKDYEVVLEKIMAFLAPVDKLPMFFCAGNVRNDPMPWRKTRKSLEKIILESREGADSTNDVKVYPLDELLFSLQHKFNPEEACGTVAIASKMLNGDPYEWSTRACEFHELKDSSNSCCLSKARRAAYLIAKYCCKKNLNLIEGSHYPHRM